MITLNAAFSATVRVIHRIHRHAAVCWTLAQPASFAGLAVGDIFVVEVTDLADGGHAVQAELPHFARRQFDQRDIAFFAEQAARNFLPSEPVGRRGRDKAPSYAAACREESV